MTAPIQNIRWCASPLNSAGAHFIPKGCLRKEQHFSVGSNVPTRRFRLEGTAERSRTRSVLSFAPVASSFGRPLGT